MSGALQLYRLFSPEAVDWPLPLDSVTLCYFFSQLDVDSVPQLLTQGALQLAAHPTTSLLGIYVGPEEEAGFEWVEEANLKATVLWIGPEGLGSEVSIRLGVEGTPQLVVIVGDQATQRLSTFPQDLLPLLPSQVLPAEVTETFTYVSLAEHLQGQDTAQVTDAYQDIARANSQMSLREISTLITALSERYQVDLSEGIQWFSAPRYGSADFEDLIDVSNITEGMFKRRLKNFCIYKSNAQLNQSQPAEVYTGNYEELRALLSIFVGFTGKKEPAKVDTRDAEIVNLTRSVSEKEQIIEQLKRELAERNTELAVLQAELEERIVPIVREPTPQSSFSIPTAESAPAAIQTESLALPRDEFDFWKFGQEEERNPSNAPKFEEIAAAKGLWILTAESQGLGPSIKDLRMRKQQAKTRKGTLPPLQHAPAGPERHAAGKKTKPVEKGLGSAGKLVPGKG